MLSSRLDKTKSLSLSSCRHLLPLLSMLFNISLPKLTQYADLCVLVKFSSCIALSPQTLSSRAYPATTYTYKCTHLSKHKHTRGAYMCPHTHLNSPPVSLTGLLACSHPRLSVTETRLLGDNAAPAGAAW